MRDINALHPRLQEKVYELIELCEKNGITIGISECLRTTAEQDALYAQGRTAPGNIVTNCKGSTYSSMHQWGVAFDFYLKQDVDGDGSISDDGYNNSTGLFDRVGRLGQSIGLEWGGSWKSLVDRPHFQLPDWGSTASNLRKQYRNPSNFMASWKGGTPKVETPTNGNGTAVVSPSSGVKIRSDASLSGNQIGSIPYKASCAVLALNVANKDGYVWAKVSYEGCVGYCAQKYLNVSTTPSSETTTTTSATTPTNVSTTYSKSTVDSAKKKNASLAGKYITTANLRLRSGAGTTKDIITLIPKGSVVNNYGYYTDVNGVSWLLISYGKYTGFSSIEYMKKSS